jgi:GNAT superfamily N-acetyltransferase
VILQMIKGLAEYERLGDYVVATEEKLRATLFGPRPAADVLIGYDGSTPVGFALFFQNYSTFLAQPGIYLEDLFVVPEARGHGYGRPAAGASRENRGGARLRTAGMVGARLE